MTRSPSDERLARERQPMPEFVREALEARVLIEKYNARPAYQRNDYLIWINDAKREATKRSRLGQMLDELEQGAVYMRMKWNG